jgi:ribosomal protein L35
MTIKTNKSFAKRLKITKSGKILARKTGLNHYNAKERHSAKAAKGNRGEFHMNNKERSRFLVNL